MLKTGTAAYFYAITYAQDTLSTLLLDGMHEMPTQTAAPAILSLSV